MSLVFNQWWWPFRFYFVFEIYICCGSQDASGSFVLGILLSISCYPLQVLSRLQGKEYVFSMVSTPHQSNEFTNVVVLTFPYRE